jgi:hypothetical protein
LSTAVWRLDLALDAPEVGNRIFDREAVDDRLAALHLLADTAGNH